MNPAPWVGQYLQCRALAAQHCCRKCVRHSPQAVAGRFFRRLIRPARVSYRFHRPLTSWRPRCEHTSAVGLDGKLGLGAHACLGRPPPRAPFGYLPEAVIHHREWLGPAQPTSAWTPHVRSLAALPFTPHVPERKVPSTQASMARALAYCSAAR